MKNEIEVIPMDLFFYHYKLDMEYYYEKYWGKDGNIMYIRNHPLAIFASDYVKYGKKVLEDLNNHIFIKYEYDRYSDSLTVKNDTHKHKASQRIMTMVDSIKKHGYCEGKYDKPKHLIRAYKSDDNIYMSGKEIYVLKTRKHRACACCALGFKEVKVKLI
jgi:hypothetical protein